MKNTISLLATNSSIVLILALLAFSCVKHNECRLLSDINDNVTWASDSSTLVFQNYTSGALYEDTTYIFGSSRTSGDSIYIYKKTSGELWIAVYQDSLELWELDRQLLGTNQQFNCETVGIIRKE